MQIDIEKLAVDVPGIAEANALPVAITAHPAFKGFLREYRHALATLVLEEAAKHCSSLWRIDGQFTADEFAEEVRTLSRQITEGK